MFLAMSVWLDHLATAITVWLIFNLFCPVTSSFITLYDFQNCDFDGISQALLLHPLILSTPHGTADDALMHFIQPVYDVIDKFVPVKAKRPIEEG